MNDDKRSMKMLQVGKPFDPSKRFHAERYQYNYDVSGHELLMFVRDLKQIEVDSVRGGRGDFALNVFGDVIFLHFRFRSAFDWSDCPYSWHMVHEANRKIPPLDIPKNEGAALRIILCDAPEGIVRALRLVAFSHKFTRALHQAIIEQSQKPFDQGDYDRQLTRLYTSYTSRQLVKMAKVRCRAGVVEPGERSD